MADALALPLALLALTATLAVALVRPRHVSEAAVALSGAVVLLAVGAISLSRAEASLRSLGPTVGFLAALLLIAEGCRRDGLFEAIGHLMARRSGRNPRRLLAVVFTVASAVTIVLGLDATVVLLPPIVFATTARLGTDPKRPLYACAHLANSASLLLPVSNLTNLLAFRASGLSFARFAVLMALPTVGAVAVEWLVISRWSPREASHGGEGGRVLASPGPGHPPGPSGRFRALPSPCSGSPCLALRSARRLALTRSGWPWPERWPSTCRFCGLGPGRAWGRCSGWCAPPSRAFSSSCSGSA